MSILSRYIFKEFGKLGAIFLLGNISLLLSILTVNRVFQKDISALMALQYTMYQLPELLISALPIISLLTGVTLLSILSRRNELIVLFSSGIPRKKIFQIFLIIGFIISSFSFLSINWLLPPVVEKRVRFQRIHIENKPDILSGISKDRLWYKNANSAYSFQGFDTNKKMVFKFSVYDLTENFEFKRNIEAKKAYYKEDGFWHLEDVTITSMSKESAIPVVEKQEKKILLTKNYPLQFEDINLKIAALNLGQLWDFVSRNRKVGINTSEHELILWHKVSLILTPIIMVALAFLLKIKNFRDQSIIRDIAICFGVTVLYFLANSLSSSVAKLNFIPTFLTAFIPCILLLCVGSGFFLLNKEAQ